MTALRAIVVDDEPLARARLCRLLERSGDASVIAECADGRSAIDRVRALRPDIVFLDVQMPELDGFGVLAALEPDAAPVIVFVTAFDRYAVRAFDAHAVDYLLKPFDAARLERALVRVRKRLSGEAIGPHLAHVLAALGAPARRERLAVPVGDRTLFVELREIDYLEAEGNYVAVHIGNRSHLVRETLATMEARLDAAAFLRIHRSRIVRLDRIRAIEPLFHGEYLLTLEGGGQVSSSRSYRNAVRAALGVS